MILTVLRQNNWPHKHCFVTLSLDNLSSRDNRCKFAQNYNAYQNSLLHPSFLPAITHILVIFNFSDKKTPSLPRAMLIDSTCLCTGLGTNIKFIAVCPAAHEATVAVCKVGGHTRE